MPALSRTRDKLHPPAPSISHVENSTIRYNLDECMYAMAISRNNMLCQGIRHSMLTSSPNKLSIISNVTLAVYFTKCVSQLESS